MVKVDESKAVLINAAELVDVDNASSGFWLVLLFDPEVPKTVAIASAEVDFDK